MPKLHVKTGDFVVVTTGKDRGKKGKILQVFPRLARVVVEGVRLTKRHIRSRKAGEPGRIIEVSMPLHVSNIQLVGANGKALRQNKRPKSTS